MGLYDSLLWVCPVCGIRQEEQRKPGWCSCLRLGEQPTHEAMPWAGVEVTCSNVMCRARFRVVVDPPPPPTVRVGLERML